MLDPNLLVVLILKVLPKEQNAITLVALPDLMNDLTLRAEPTCKNCNVDKAEPILTTLLIEILEPRFTCSTILNLKQLLVCTSPKTDRVEPSLTLALNERDDPMLQNPRVDIAEPHLIKLLTDNALAKVDTLITLIW
jgi:hypothetical protein